jgi:hypothetical protein
MQVDILNYLILYDMFTTILLLKPHRTTACFWLLVPMVANYTFLNSGVNFMTQS